MSRVCSSCETENVDEAKFCRKCGGKIFKEEHQSKNVAINSKFKLDDASSEIKEENVSNVNIFDARNEPSLLFVGIFWPLFFATLIMIEHHRFF